jgi:methionine-rich copper-binding protein CopC
MIRKTILLGGTLMLAAGLALSSSVFAPAAADAATLLHFALTKSAPTDGATVPAPSEVRLWFTQVPQENSVAVRLLDRAGDPVETGDLQQDPEDGTIFSLELEGTLPSGGYTVSWRGIGEDGHVVRGDFGFTVSAQ